MMLLTAVKANGMMGGLKQASFVALDCLYHTIPLLVNNKHNTLKQYYTIHDNQHEKVSHRPGNSRAALIVR